MVCKDRHFIYLAWLNDDSSNALMSFESATAVDVLALMVTFFCFTRNVTAAFGVCGSLAARAMHHGKPSLSNEAGVKFAF